MSAELPPGVGTVGEELSRLIAALSARQGTAAGTTERAETDVEAAEEVPVTDSTDSTDVANEATEGPPGPAEPSTCTCGCHTGAVPTGQAQACALCPLCQGIATLRTLNPELLDRLARLAALAADTLRELAADAASARRPAATPEPPHSPRPGRRPRVDIDVVDEPTEGAPGGGQAQG